MGYSHGNFVEFKGDLHKLNFRTLQGLIQVDTVFHQGDGLSWTGAAGISASRTASFAGNSSAPFLVAGGGEDGRTRSGNLKISTTVSGITGPTAWNANGYLLQGFPGITSDKHLHNLDLLGIDVGEARALGGLANLTLLATPNVSLSLRGGGQVAFSSLPSSMGFSLGSDVGLIGLPGSIASGDSGWLAVGELIWTVWEKDKQQLQLLPYIGKGGIHTKLAGVIFEDQVGSGGLIARYTQDRWQLEIGWANTFETKDNPGTWNDWWLGHGVHTKLRYAF
jgi:hemolysin activation/secretion protein